MCEKTNYHNISNTRIDACMRKAVNTLSIIFSYNNIRIVACCCGHGKYPMTIIYRLPKNICFELFSGKVIWRRKKYYKRDDKGFYYIPEVSDTLWGVK